MAHRTADTAAPRRAVRRAHCSHRSWVGVGSASSSSACGSTAAASDCWAGVIAFPQTAQNFASAASAPPQFGQPTTGGVAAAGRPQLAQKCEPQTSGAPQAHRAAGAARRVGDRGCKQRVELLQALVERDQLVAALDQQVLAELVAAEHLEHEAAEVA